MRDPHPWSGGVVRARIGGRPGSHRSVSGGRGGGDANFGNLTATVNIPRFEVAADRSSPQLQANQEGEEDINRRRRLRPQGHLIDPSEPCTSHNHHGGNMPVTRTMSRVLLTAAAILPLGTVCVSSSP